MLLCRRRDLGFVGIKIDYDTSFVNGTHTYNWEETNGEAAITKLQELAQKPIKCFLRVVMCTGDGFACDDAIKINHAFIDEKGIPHVSFDFYDNGTIMGGTYYCLNGWGVKETKEVNVKEYHLDGDTIKNERTVKQLLSAGSTSFDVVLEDGKIITADSIRRIWLPQKEVPGHFPFETRMIPTGDVNFVTFEGIKYCVKYSTHSF
ncbi:MAG: hypothetical protein IKI57_00230 [Clostridia bacterium]|nr:hypothetical protein [Clostridia bacterium]